MFSCFAADMGMGAPGGTDKTRRPLLEDGARLSRAASVGKPRRHRKGDGLGGELGQERKQERLGRQRIARGRVQSPQGLGQLRKLRHIAVNHDRIRRIRPEKLAGKLGMSFCKCSNQVWVNGDIDQMRLFTFALQRMGICGTDKDHVAFAKILDAVIDPVPDTSIYDPEKLKEIMGVHLFWTFSRGHGSCDQKGIAFGKDIFMRKQHRDLVSVESHQISTCANAAVAKAGDKARFGR